jgi:hypothetical protein
MMMDHDKPSLIAHEEQIGTWKDQLNEFFDDDPARAAAAGPRKPFKVYLRETPADPLSPGVKVLLWVAGLLVAALLIAALVRGPRPRAAAAPAAPNTVGFHDVATRPAIV